MSIGGWLYTIALVGPMGREWTKEEVEAFEAELKLVVREYAEDELSRWREAFDRWRRSLKENCEWPYCP